MRACAGLSSRAGRPAASRSATRASRADAMPSATQRSNAALAAAGTSARGDPLSAIAAARTTCAPRALSADRKIASSAWPVSFDSDSIATSRTLSFTSVASARKCAVSDNTSAARAAYIRICHCRCFASLAMRRRASTGWRRASATSAWAAACHDTPPAARRGTSAGSASIHARRMVPMASSVAHGAARRSMACSFTGHALSANAARRAPQSLLCAVRA